MPRVLLILALLAAQLVSWSASPLFLCFDDDGDLSIDLGPGACQCTGHPHHASERPDSPIQAEHIASSDCDCVHVQLTVAWTAVTVNSKETRTAALSNVPAFLSSCDCPGSFTPAREASPIHRLIARGHEGPARSAVLRC